jgi:Family of unknown function (DUF5715)
MAVLVHPRIFAARAALALLFSSGYAVAQSNLLLATSLSPMIQNDQADEEGLVRFGDEQTLQRYVRSRLLVKVPANSRTYYLKGVPARYGYLRPWSKRFLDDVGSQFHAKFNDRLRVTSLVRTSSLQLQLASHNTNAAPATGRTQSSHLTGATLDISKARMSAAQREWMRAKLVALASRGYLYGIEERVQPTFHVMVYKHFPSAAMNGKVHRGAKSTKVVRVVKLRKLHGSKIHATSRPSHRRS